MIELPLVIFCQAKQGRAACVILATAMLWMTEAMPLMITALVPAIMFPLVGVMDTKEVSRVVMRPFSYLNSYT